MAALGGSFVDTHSQYTAVDPRRGIGSGAVGAGAYPYRCHVTAAHTNWNGRYGSQMLAVPDAAYLFDYRKSLPTTGAEKVTFLVDAVDHFTFLDKGYSQIAGGISFYAKRDLPNW